MFYASILFCWISLNGPQCVVAEDSLGPYKEVTQCQERIEDMSERILEEMPFARFAVLSVTEVGTAVCIKALVSLHEPSAAKSK